MTQGLKHADVLVVGAGPAGLAAAHAAAASGLARIGLAGGIRFCHYGHV